MISELPGVQEVSLTSIPHEDDGEHPVACVVRSPGSTVTAEQIKKIVASTYNIIEELVWYGHPYTGTILKIFLYSLDYDSRL